MQYPRKFMSFSIAVITLSLQQNSATLFGAARPSLFVQNPILAQSISIICTNIPGLSSKQQEICMLKPKAMNAISNGFHMAIKECENQFQHSRWNCTSLLSRDHLFESRAVAGTREAAFFSAITSAGITHAVATSCSQDNNSDCSCNELAPDSTVKNIREKFKWDGCNMNIRQGLKTALEFLREQDLKVTSENDRRAFNLMHRHNIKAGRQVVRDMMVTECKCAGVSGSCNIKKCWRKLPYFREVGNTLKKLYKVATRVQPKMSKMAQGYKATHLVRFRTSDRKPPTKNIVFMTPYVNYCDKNVKLGVPGTVRRKCSLENTDEFQCKTMCCDRGYDTHQYNHTRKCECKFKWCCSVACNTCVEERTERYCK